MSRLLKLVKQYALQLLLTFTTGTKRSAVALSTADVGSDTHKVYTTSCLPICTSSLELMQFPPHSNIQGSMHCGFTGGGIEYCPRDTASSSLHQAGLYKVTNFWAESAKLAYSTFIHRTDIRQLTDWSMHRNASGRRVNSNDIGRHLVSFGRVTSQFTRLQCLQQGLASINTWVCYSTFARRRHS